MTLKELMYDVRQELHFAKQLPFSLTDEDIKRVIDIAAEYFWDNWLYAVETAYVLMPYELFQDKAFLKHRTIVMPDCIQFVHDLREIKGGSMFATIDRDFSEQKFIGSEIFLTPLMGESILYRTVVFSFLDLTKSLVLDTIAYHYNKNSKHLFIQGHTPHTASVARVAKKLEPEFLYNDETYKRYVRVQAKLRLSEMMQLTDFNLPGNVKLNFAVMAQNAQGVLDKLKEEIEKQQPPSFMILDRF